MKVLKIAISSILLLTSSLLSAKVTAPSLEGRAGGESTGGGSFSSSSYVNVLVGTMSKHSLSTGNTYPAIALPWGMNFWTPQTGRMGDGWAYVYTEDKLRGIKQTHQPSPWINDYGQFALMPTTRTVFKEDDRASWFSHKAEVATPYYYKVYLADWDVVAELTPTERAAMMRLTYPATDEGRLVIDPFDKGSYVFVDQDHRRVLGYTTKNSGGVPENFKNYFVIEFSHPISFVATADGDQLQEGRVELKADHAQAVVGFPTLRRGEQVTLRIASSFISFEQAQLNLRELGTRSFDEVCAAGRQRWDDVLGRIEIEDPDIDHLRTFYSCLYRSVLFPRSFFEYGADGKPVHYSPHTGEVLPGRYFTDTGFWDTFRCLFPLLNLVYPEMNIQMQEGLVNCYKESGFLPEWASPGHRGCMVGNNSASVVADAYLKLSSPGILPASSSASVPGGIPAGATTPYDIEALWQAVTHGANAVHPRVSSTGRLGFDYYNRLGYVPYDVKINESVARTLEYAYDDWCIYQLGKKLGKPEAELKPFREHAMNYKNVFDPETRLMRGRMKDGKFQAPFNPLKWGDAFTEGNAWHYTWSVFHDPEGLIRLMGGRESFVAMLDSVFNVPPLFDESYYGGVIHEIREMQIMNMGNYAHGNQPIQHMIYLYDWAAEPWKAQQRVREVMDRFYTPLPDGYCGDEDNGQTSAWYVFSALGFYPVCPGSGEYALGTPYFHKATLHFPNQKDLVITATSFPSSFSSSSSSSSSSASSPLPSPSAVVASPSGEVSSSFLPPFIQRMTFNGVPYDRNFLRHEDLVRGGNITFELGQQPNRQRGTSPSSAPYSFSKE